MAYSFRGSDPKSCWIISEPPNPSEKKNGSIVCGEDHPCGGGILDYVRFHGRMWWGGFGFELELTPHGANRNRHPKSLGGNLHDPDGVSRADDGGVWSHDVVWKKHRLVSGDH